MGSSIDVNAEDVTAGTFTAAADPFTRRRFIANLNSQKRSRSRSDSFVHTSQSYAYRRFKSKVNPSVQTKISAPLTRDSKDGWDLMTFYRRYTLRG